MAKGVKAPVKLNHRLVPDLENILWALVDPDDENHPLLMSIRDQFFMLFTPVANQERVYFNIMNVEDFETDLAEWVAAHPLCIILDRMYLLDETDTKLYMITFLNVQA